MLRQIFIVLLLCSVHGNAAWALLAQSVEMSSSPNPVGSGARAAGMGGAFIGMADDATAASWNPAGLIQLELPEVSVVGDYFFRREDTTYEAFPDAAGPHSVSEFDINYFSAAYPFTLFNRNMVVSLNYQRLYDFDRSVELDYLYEPEGLPFTAKESIRYDQSGSFSALSPAFAIQILPRFSLGLTINFWDHGLTDSQWESEHKISGNGDFSGFSFDYATTQNESYNTKGTDMAPLDIFGWENVNANLGLMWNVSNKLSLSAVFKTPFVAQLKHDFRWESEMEFPAVPLMNVSDKTTFSELVYLDMPGSVGAGLACRINDSLTLDLDVYHTMWDDHVLRDSAGNEFNPIPGQLKADSKVDGTTQVRAGCEYLIIGATLVFPIRGGLFYDPEPSENHPDDFWGMGIGSGIAYKNMVYDWAYQYRFGKDVRAARVGGKYSSSDVDQHTVFMSLIYHF